MELISLTEDEIELALIKGDVAEVWLSFFRFLAWEITRYERSINIPPEGGQLWEAWYLGFIRRSIVAYAPLGPFPHHQGPDAPSMWLDSASNVTTWSRSVVSIIASTVREKQAAIAKQQTLAGTTPSDVDPPGHNSGAAPSNSPLETTSPSIATTGNPRPPICFRTIQKRHPGSDKLSDTVYLYFHSPPSLQSFLQSLRKRHELRAGDKIASLRVKVPYEHILVMIGEEQEEWDWEGALEDASGYRDRATIIFEVQSE